MPHLTSRHVYDLCTSRHQPSRYLRRDLLGGEADAASDEQQVEMESDCKVSKDNGKDTCVYLKATSNKNPAIETESQELKRRHMVSPRRKIWERELEHTDNCTPFILSFPEVLRS